MVWKEVKQQTKDGKRFKTKKSCQKKPNPFFTNSKTFEVKSIKTKSI